MSYFAISGADLSQALESLAAAVVVYAALGASLFWAFNQAICWAFERWDRRQRAHERAYADTDVLVRAIHGRRPRQRGRA